MFLPVRSWIPSIFKTIKRYNDIIWKWFHFAMIGNGCLLIHVCQIKVWCPWWILVRSKRLTSPMYQTICYFSEQPAFPIQPPANKVFIALPPSSPFSPLLCLSPPLLLLSLPFPSAIPLRPGYFPGTRGKNISPLGSGYGFGEPKR